MSEKSHVEGRPVTSLLALLLFPLFAGILLAPHVYNFLKNTSILHDVEFERVANRCVLAMTLVFLFPLVRRAGLSRQIKNGLAFTPARRRDFVMACCFGFFSMAAIYIGGLCIGAYRVGEDIETLMREVGIILSFLTGAIFIGFFEEAFFRGFVFGALRRRLSFWLSAVFASVFFSGVHFIQPRLPQPVGRADAWDGFALIPHLFDGFIFGKQWPFMVTLFIMGLTLCLLYERRGHLYYAIGLHGGWVLAMQMGNHLLDRNRDYLQFWFSRSDLISKGVIAIPIILLFLVWALRSKSHRHV